MAQHPEMYSADELAKFAANTSAAPQELASPAENGPLVSPATPGGDGPHELDAKDKFTKQQEAELGQKFASMCETEATDFDNEEHDNLSSYSGHEQVAQASPLVQVRSNRNTIDSVLDCY